MPGTSAKAWRTRSPAAGFPRADRRTPRCRREHRAGAVGEQAVEPRDDRGARRQLPGGARPRVRRPRVQAVGHQHHARRRDALAEDRAQQDLGAGVVAGEQRARAEHLGAEAAEHLGEPVERVGVAGPRLGVAVQRQVGQHDAKAVGELLDRRLPLLVREQPRVQQRQRRPGADLAVGHARAVVMVVEAQAHRSIVGAKRGPPTMSRP